MDLRQKPFFLKEDELNWVENTLKSMSLEEKVGQIFCVLGNLYSEKQLINMVRNKTIGGCLLRPDSTEEVIRKFETLDKVARIPLLKAANLEEGGNGAIEEGTRYGSQMQIAATNDSVWAARFGKLCAKEGQSVGINWTFSPVVDIDKNFRNPITNTRTYGNNVDRVEEMSLTYIKAVQSSGMSACAKHFPGDGVDYRDQHLHPTVNSLSAEEWHNSYGRVYQTLIDNNLLSIMVGHIMQPDCSKEMNPALKDHEILPASLSKELLTDFLRNRMNFNGLITTDATIMGGYTQAMERKKAIPMTIAAGCDMIVFNTSFEEDYQYLLEGVKNGLVSEQRVNDAVSRILALKAHMHLYTKKEKKLIEELPVKQWQQECARKSVTLVKNLKNLLPISSTKYKKIRVITLGNCSCPEGEIYEIAKELLENKGFEVEEFVAVQNDIVGPGTVPKDRLTLYLANCEAKSDLTAVRLFWSEKLALDLPRFIEEEEMIFVSFANPYHLQDVPRMKTFINAYTATKATIYAVIEKITGSQIFEGISPVDPFCGLFDTRL